MAAKPPKRKTRDKRRRGLAILGDDISYGFRVER
jgi:hypothetical protein